MSITIIIPCPCSLLGPSQNPGLSVAAVTPPCQQGAPAALGLRPLGAGLLLPSPSLGFSLLEKSGRWRRRRRRRRLSRPGRLVWPVSPRSAAPAPRPAPWTRAAAAAGPVRGRARTEGGGRGQGGPWERGPPAQRRPVPALPACSPGAATMAASAKRKQEEKHLKMLRDMTGLPHNRKCFDCDQRGPTYVNMTVGSFVCTSCSGSL